MFFKREGASQKGGRAARSAGAVRTDWKGDSSGGGGNGDENEKKFVTVSI